VGRKFYPLKTSMKQLGLIGFPTKINLSLIREVQVNQVQKNNNFYLFYSPIFPTTKKLVASGKYNEFKLKMYI
jgi:hypothetical protein